jgi:drug/metabolite transporter (DMT)-like permease
MFALIACVFFLLGAFIPDFHSHNWVGWLMLGLAAMALHFAVGLSVNLNMKRGGPR